ncbi:phospholipase A [Pontibacter silvestris]|uniref:Phosphatidylcholine 1-acylhydrolase n=1 Tax=Pontibacter silvestris TaxID=2305183 RepID=A0ABW4X441_9BACT|nr:phospholipase A [Pontibacter silvestris]MCC9137153.1 phospholipase A [Pontibacter silvestris]
MQKIKSRIRKNMWGLCLFILVISINTVYGQQISRDSVNRILRTTPPFTIYKDNYIITGSTIGEKPTSSNSDVKYQISFKHRLTNASLPLNSYLFLTYTQLAFWDIYHWSSPFNEINFNPGLGLGKLLFKDGKLIGSLALQVEHESNGWDSTMSRSWNYASFSYTTAISSKSILQLKAWVPFFYKQDNPDIIDYVGYGQATYIWEIKKDKLLLDVTGRKGTSGWKGNIQTQLSFKPFKSGNAFVTLQWYQGYAESLSQYQQSTSMLRLGIAIKPPTYLFY